MPHVDVCLVVEGSYPYITGGVASWVHQLVMGLPDISFALVTLVPDARFRREDRYPVPANVVHRQDVLLFEPLSEPRRRREPSPALMEALAAFHETPAASRCPVFGRLESLLRGGGPGGAALLSARASWKLLERMYERRGHNVSFLDYFWTWRAIHGPLLRLLETPLPQARVYHSLSTGYGGFLAGVAKLRCGAGMALTEHGLYTREREIEIFKARWIYDEPGGGEGPRGFFKGWWRRQFRFLGTMSYDLADRIVTLHEPNRQLQLDAGAPAEKLVVVPNGIFPDRYAAARAPRDWSGRPFRVGMIGRVVPIKDVKTFLRAVQLAHREAALEAHVLGPLDEDPAYADECRALVAALGLEGVVTFHGAVDVSKWLPRLDLNVLSSISESQPLVILEAAAAGVPSVATDVGACREMLEGQTGEDAALGPSGLVVPVVSPAALASAIASLAADPARHRALAEAGIRRVERFYRQEAVYDYYRGLYRDLAAGREAA